MGTIELLSSPEDCTIASKRDYEIDLHPILLVFVLEQQGNLSLSNYLLIAGIIILLAFFECINDPLVNKKTNFWILIRYIPTIIKVGNMGQI